MMRDASELRADLSALEGDQPAVERQLDSARLEAVFASEAGDVGAWAAAGRRVEALERLVAAHRDEIAAARAALEELDSRVASYAGRAEDARARLEVALVEVEEARRQVDAERVLAELGEGPKGALVAAERMLEAAIARRDAAQVDVELFERTGGELRSRQAEVAERVAASRRFAGLWEYEAACVALEAVVPDLLGIFGRLAASAKDCGLRGLSAPVILAPLLAVLPHRTDAPLVEAVGRDRREVEVWLERLEAG